MSVITSPSLLDEIRSTLSEPRLSKKYGLSNTEVEQFLELLLLRSLVVFPTGAVKQCRDPRDDFLLEAALLGHADYLVSRDDDIKRDADLIQSMGKEGIRILSVRQFLHHLK